MTEPAVPDALPAGGASVVGTQLERIAQIAAELGDQALASDAQADHDRLVEARFFVACLGQFKRGKSTLLNALVGQPILPVGVVPVTSVVTILRHGDRPTAMVRFRDGHTEPIALDTIAMFIDERQNPGNRRHAIVVDVALPSPILRDGLYLVDTPGLGSVHAANTEATRAFVPRTDVALVVVGPDPPISGAELQLIEEVTGGSPLTWLIDRFAPRGVRQTQVARAATAYLTQLLESNSHRVEDDLKERTRESRRWLEGQIRTRLAGALQSADRAVTVATEKQHLSQTEVQESLAQADTLRHELAVLLSRLAWRHHARGDVAR